MLVSWNNEQVLAMSETLYDGAQDTMPDALRNRESECFPYENQRFSLWDVFNLTVCAPASPRARRENRVERDAKAAVRTP
jgi:hypothetical protein